LDRRRESPVWYAPRIIRMKRTICSDVDILGDEVDKPLDIKLEFSEDLLFALNGHIYFATRDEAGTIYALMPEGQLPLPQGSYEVVECQGARYAVAMLMTLIEKPPKRRVVFDEDLSDWAGAVMQEPGAPRTPLQCEELLHQTVKEFV
jgi:hypothetical protein